MSISLSPFLMILISSTILLGDAGPASASGAAVAPGAEQQKHADTTFLPVCDVFKPLIADLKQPRFYVSYHRYHSSAENVNISSVGVGESFGLYRAVDPVDGAGWQVSFGGGLLAQFNLDTSSKDLLNTDYFAGVPISYRRGPLS